MFKVISNNSTREYSSAREVAKDMYFREKRAGKTSLSFDKGIKFYMGFIGENIQNDNRFDMFCGGKKIIIEYHK